MSLIYSLVIHVFYMVVQIASPFNKKARLWIQGRKGWRKKLRMWHSSGSPVFWFHAASLGEFEQGRPLIEEIKKRLPGCCILLTFYSPSGYEVRKNYQWADLVIYLPLDTWYNARCFINLVKPDAVFFIKYEFWYFYLKQLHRMKLPVYLVSGIFRSGQIFFRWYGSWFRSKLRYFTHFFMQDQASADLLTSLGFCNYTISGDTRFDRVIMLKIQVNNIEIAEAFSTGHFCLVAGSTWIDDEKLLVRLINEIPDIKLIIAPHEIDEAHIANLRTMLKAGYILFSKSTKNNITDKQILIIDNIGLLSSLYRYGQLAYIGGGFGKGIHNILEASAFSLPVIFGPNYLKSREAIDLLRIGGAFTINNYDELYTTVYSMKEDPVKYKALCLKAFDYVLNNKGATEIILEKANIAYL
jgi:3-deoxy-D-manno-octulosonic-acid transferase